MLCVPPSKLVLHRHELLGSLGFPWRMLERHWQAIHRSERTAACQLSNVGGHQTHLARSNWREALGGGRGPVRPSPARSLIVRAVVEDIFRRQIVLKSVFRKTCHRIHIDK